MCSNSLLWTIGKDYIRVHPDVPYYQTQSKNTEQPLHYAKIKSTRLKPFKEYRWMLANSYPNRKERNKITQIPSWFFLGEGGGAEVKNVCKTLKYLLHYAERQWVNVFLLFLHFWCWCCNTCNTQILKCPTRYNFEMVQSFTINNLPLSFNLTETIKLFF